MEELGWKEGDMIEWIPNDDGSFTLMKKEHA
jgi:bifunctional DNA-binding transcriptional regulator/antitoxin component of YhaV-PrlF toxin-antitoxin module